MQVSKYKRLVYMNAIRNIYAVLALIALCLSSCEMKNELEGKYNLKNDEGLLTLDLVNKTQATPSTKAESTSLTDELDVNTYKVEIVDNATEAVVRSFADDYVFTVSNGIGGVIYVKKEDLGSIYLSIPNGATSIKIVAKVTEKETGRDIETIYTVTKPDEEGLEGGDSFNVTVKPVEEGEDPENPDVTPSDPKLGI